MRGGKWGQRDTSAAGTSGGSAVARMEMGGGRGWGSSNGTRWWVGGWVRLVGRRQARRRHLCVGVSGGTLVMNQKVAHTATAAMAASDAKWQPATVCPTRACPHARPPVRWSSRYTRQAVGGVDCGCLVGGAWATLAETAAATTRPSSSRRPPSSCQDLILWPPWTNFVALRWSTQNTI